MRNNVDVVGDFKAGGVFDLSDYGKRGLREADLRKVPPIVMDATPFVIHPASFFPAWCGVMTLAMRDGWPKQIEALKSKLAAELPLVQENHGTRWVKITLGARKDAAPMFDEGSAEELFRVCAQFESALRDVPPITVSTLKVVAFARRSLEQRYARSSMPLRGGSSPSTVVTKEAQEVQNAVLAQAASSNLEKYRSDMNRPGQRYESRYCSEHFELTLVADVGRDLAPELRTVIREFQCEVDHRIGHYGWFAEESLHVSVRALVPQRQ